MRIGFIGGHGHHYLRHVQNDSQTGSVIDRAFCGDGHDDPRAVAFGETLAGAARFDSIADLLARFRPDVVSVGAVYGFNGDVVARVLSHDVPVVSDKPLAATWKQLDAIREAAAKTGRHVITEFPFRTQREMVAARDVVTRGDVGPVALVTAMKSYRFGQSRPRWYTDRASYGGTLLWVLSHAIDVIPFISGLSVRRVIGTGGNATRPEYGSMEDHVTVTMQLTGGATAVAHADFLRPAAAPTHGDDRVRVAGSDGVVEVRDDRCRLITHTQPDTDVTDAAPAQPPTGLQLLKAVFESTGDLSTEQSFHTAHLLLKCRDAADAREWVDV